MMAPYNTEEARFSPDGRFVAYRSDETGQDEIHGGAQNVK
jgi:rRNA maturation protein Nop10